MSSIVGAYVGMGGAVKAEAIELFAELAGVSDDDLEIWIHGLICVSREQRAR
jgi:hypothetical protein